VTRSTFDAAIRFAQELIRIPSPPGGEGAVAARLRDELDHLGFDGVTVDDTGSVRGVVRGNEAGPSVMLSCHLDVVAEGDPDEWEHPPFSGAIADGFLHGRGAMDIKGPLALQVYAAAALQGRAPGDVWVAHTVFEERGGLGMKRLMESGAVKPDVVVIGESTHGDICVGHRGRGELEVVLHGLAGHASAPDRALNALDLVPAILDAVRDLSARQPEDPVLGRASLVATGVEVLPESRNVIPDRVTVVLDWRVLPDQTQQSLVRDVEAAVSARLPEVPEGMSVTVRMARERQRTWTGLDEERDLFTPGFLMDPDHPAVVAAARAVGVQGGDGAARVRPWTFATDGGWTRGVHGIPTVGFAPGEERYAHTNRERLDLMEARWAFERMPAMILAMQEALARGS
jgi:putative selenium metabolism hydrolase